MPDDITNLAILGIIAAFTLGVSVVAFAQRNLVHGVLLLAATWFGLAAFYLWAGAEFIAFAQVLVHVGAISMAALFAVLLTRRGGDPAEPQPARDATIRRAVLGVFTAIFAALLLAAAIFATPFAEFPANPAAAPAAPIATASAAAPSALRAIGESLFSTHAAALLATGVLLTAALLGSILLAADPSVETKLSRPSDV